MAGYPKGLREGIERKRSRYDIACKRVLSIKSILARILGTLLAEYRDCPFDTIAERCIEGSPIIGVVPVVGGEAVDPAAGSVVFDIVFRALVPSSELPGLWDPGDPGDVPELVVDVEAQDDFYPGYPLTKRAVYYCARLLNNQRGTEFSGSHYERIKKVCSIWICTKPPRERQGAVSWIQLGERRLPADARPFDQGSYDLLAVITVCLRDEDTGEREGVEGLVNLLTVLLSRRLSAQEKLSVLREYNIEVTDEFESEVPRMLDTVEEILLEGWNKGLSEGREAGIAEGRREGQENGRTSAFADSLRNLMQATGWSLKTAMDSLGIPEAERSSCAALVKR